MEIEEQDARATAEYEGQTYYFCCLACREEFLKHPQAYAPRQLV
jgi:YHS domain-containing protein